VTFKDSVGVVDRIDARHLLGGHDGREHCPVLDADLIAGKEGILPCKSNRADLVFDRVVVDFEEAII
jgi:hypothetical protein